MLKLSCTTENQGAIVQVGAKTITFCELDKLLINKFLGRDAGIPTVVAFLRGIADSRFHVVALTDSALKRVGEILEKYADSRIDFVDASVMAVAERYGSTKILTLDQKD